jgi:hypothetical protein
MAITEAYQLCLVEENTLLEHPSLHLHLSLCPEYEAEEVSDVQRG